MQFLLMFMRPGCQHAQAMRSCRDEDGKARVAEQLQHALAELSLNESQRQAVEQALSRRFTLWQVHQQLCTIAASSIPKWKSQDCQMIT